MSFPFADFFSIHDQLSAIKINMLLIEYSSEYRNVIGIGYEISSKLQPNKEFKLKSQLIIIIGYTVTRFIRC